MKHAVVFGGYGVFGSHVARELVKRGIKVVIVGRDRQRAEAFTKSLGPVHDAAVADLSDFASCRRLLSEDCVAVNCAGPFRSQNTALLDACLQAGSHYVDIADDRAYVQTVRSYGERFRERGLVAAYGCSSLPGISGALALAACDGIAEKPRHSRITLFIGNRNPKGLAAVSSLVCGLGRPINAPQGTLRGFHDRKVVALPWPFGRRGVFNFDAPDYDLFPGLIGVQSVVVKVGFELRSTTYTMALLAKLRANWTPRAARTLALAGKPLQWLGSSGGAVMTELFWPDGTARSAAICGPHDGQRMAALPCAVVAQSLCTDQQSMHGSFTAYELCGGKSLLQQLETEGFQLTVTHGTATDQT
jgi:hypothetical protein